MVTERPGWLTNADRTVLAKIAPRPAIPTAMPTWRKVLLMPEPTPAFSLLTVPTAAEASTGFVTPEPTPETIIPASRTVQPEVAEIIVISARPTAIRPSPPPISRRGGTRPDSRPAIGAARMIGMVSGRNRSPV